ncbi:MAG: thiolase domain-containing protein [Anaerolineales bacterium]|nr:thiolase domain-containing protein [Anaerolineales bacterium]
MRDVSIVGIGYLPVKKEYTESLRTMGSQAVEKAMQSVGVDRIDSLFVSNYGCDEFQGQKHLGPLIADELNMTGIEAMEVRAACAAGGGSLRVAQLTVASGQSDIAVVVGVEKMDPELSAEILAKALDAEQDVPRGETMLSIIAQLTRMYRDAYNIPEDAFDNFPLLAHHNAEINPSALFHGKNVTSEKIHSARTIIDPVKLYDCSPVCDGAAAVILAPTDQAHLYTDTPMRMLGSAVANDRMVVSNRKDPLAMEAAKISAEKAMKFAGVTQNDIDLFEVHDAFSIITALSLEATGFAKRGEGWRLGQEKRIWPDGDIPISTRGGLKGRGHPIGATALYQTCEIFEQLTGRAGENQLQSPEIAMMNSVGGAAATLITHIFAAG